MENNSETISNFVPNGIYVYDFTKGAYAYINKYFSELIGYSLDELNSMHPEDLLNMLHPNYRQALIKHRSEISKLKKGEILSIDYQFKSKSKGWLWGLSQVSGYEYDNEGNMISYIGSLVNINEQKQTEQALKELTISYQELVQNSPLGMHFYSLDDKNQLIFENANLAASQLLGVDNSQFIGKSICEAFPPLLKTEVPDRYRDAALHGTPWTTEQISYDDEKITGAFKVTAFQTKPGSMIAVFDDITERKQAEQTIKKSEKLYRLLADTSTDMIARHDKNGVFLYVSPACTILLGYEPEELLGQSAFEFFHPDDLADLEKNRKMILEQPDYTTVTFRFRKKNGEYTWLETNTHSIFDKDSRKIIELHASSRDVSEQVKSRHLIQQQNQKLEALNATKDKFFSLLSHDLRSPISTINQMLNLLNENIYDYEIEKVGQHISVIADATNNLASLVDDVLMWASSQSGKIPFNPQVTSFSKIAQETIAIIKTTASAKNIAINLIENNIKLIADVNMLKTILRNLISNAIKFTNKGGKIDIKAKQDDVNTTIAITDNGIGITPRVKEKLFDISESISEPGTEGEKGTGIGLAICKEFVEKHNGTIWVDSKPGKGSTFSFKLPLITNKGH